MPLSDLDRQLLLIQDVGDVDPDTGDPVLPTAQGSTGIVMRNVAQLWQKYSDKAVVDVRLRDLYVAKEAYDLTIGVLERLVNFSVNNGQINISLAKRADVRREQRDAIWKEILRLESLLSSNQPPSVVAIAALAPIQPPLPGQYSSPSLFGPDANDPRFTGSPYWPSTRSRP